MGEPRDGGELSPAADAFAEFLAAVEDGEQPDFEAFCAAHPTLAPRLRALHGRWQALRGVFGDLEDANPAAPADAGSDRVQLDSDDASSTRLLAGLAREDAARPRYKVAGEFARGGMAAILRVRDTCLRRTLAMKVLLAESLEADLRGRADPRTLARFLEEAQITGQLDHPGIPPVHELGIDGNGRVYFTMPLIQGNNLSQVYALVRAERDGWSVPRAVAVLQRVCETVAYAHSRGVVHRDLKPSNVMVGRFGETYVMDWGLAQVRGRESRVGARAPEHAESSIRTLRREIAEDTPDSPLATKDGHVLGTPAYMAPEQARGDSAAVGPHSDVYAIGAMLYELLLGAPPYVPEGAKVTARTILARVLEGPPAPLRSQGKALPQELVAVCEKAMARDVRARYAGATELGADLRAWLEGRVVHAHASGTWAELRKWVARNRVLAAAGVLLFVTLAVALVVTSTLRGVANASAARLASELRRSNLERGRLFAQSGNLEQAESLLWAEHLRTPDARETRWALWDLHVRYPCLATVDFAEDLRLGALVDEDRTLLVGDTAGSLHCVDPATLARKGSIALPTASPVTAMGSDDAGQVFTAHEDGTVHVTDLASRKAVRTLRTTNTVARDLAWSRHGASLLLGCTDGSLVLYDTKTWSMRRAAESVPSQVFRVAWSPDGRHFAASSSDWTTRVFAADTGKLVASYRAGDRPGAVAFADASHLLFGGQDRTLFTMDLATGVTEATLPKSDSFSSILFGPDGEMVLGGWQRIEVWNRLPLRHLRTIEIPRYGANHVLDRAGRTVFSIHRHEVRAWDLADRGRWTLPGHEGRVVSRIAPDGKTVVTGDSTGALRCFELDGAAAPRQLGRHEGRVRLLAFGQDGRLLLSGGGDRKLMLWDLREGRLLHTFDDHDDSGPQTACFSPDGRTFAAAVRRQGRAAVVLRSVADFTETRRIPFASQVVSIVFSPGGSTLACASRNASVRLCDLEGSTLREFATTEQSWALAFRADGHRLAVGTWGRLVDVFDPTTGVKQTSLEGHNGPVWSIAWLPQDPDVLCSAGADGAVILWDAASGRALLSTEPFGRGNDAIAVSVSASGQRLVASGAHATAVTWDVEHFEQLVVRNQRAQQGRSTGPAAK